MHSLLHISKILPVLCTQFVASFLHCTGVIFLNECVSTGLFVLEVHCALLQMKNNHLLFHYVFAVLGFITTLFGTLLPELYACKYSVRTAQ
jgi:hypothetical protein